jgi:hypothetical protein
MNCIEPLIWFSLHPHIREDFNKQYKITFEYLYDMVDQLRLCSGVLRGRKGKVKEGRRRKGREGRDKGGKSFPLFGN